MKKIILILTILASGLWSMSAQMTSNELTTTEYNSIKVHGVLKTDIEATQGDIQEMETLFGSAQLIEEETDGIGDGYRNFIYSNNLSFTFTDVYSSEFDASIESFETNNICINDIQINVGDNISILGDIVFNQNTDGTQSIIYTHLFYDCCPIIIDFDQNTNIITKIEYIVFS